MGRQMATWAQVAEALECLPVAVREARRREGLSLREMADVAGVSFSTVSRLETGEGVHLTQAMALIRWLAGPVLPVGSTEGETTEVESN